MTEKISFQAVSEGPHFILYPLAGKKTIAKSNLHPNKKSATEKPFFYIDKIFFETDGQAGVHTRKRTIKMIDVSVEPGFSLSGLFEFFPGLLSKKWLSQSQVMKIYKHFRNQLAIDDMPNLFLCKKNESFGLDEEDEDPWKNLQIIELLIDYEDDTSIRTVDHNVIFSKSVIAGNFRLFIPVRCGQK